jgi:hypothetical protein
VTLLVGLHII